MTPEGVFMIVMHTYNSQVYLPPTHPDLSKTPLAQWRAKYMSDVISGKTIEAEVV